MDQQHLCSKKADVIKSLRSQLKRRISRCLVVSRAVICFRPFWILSFWLCFFRFEIVCLLSATRQKTSSRRAICWKHSNFILKHCWFIQSKDAIWGAHRWAHVLSENSILSLKEKWPWDVCCVTSGPFNMLPRHPLRVFTYWVILPADKKHLARLTLRSVSVGIVLKVKRWLYMYCLFRTVLSRHKTLPEWIGSDLHGSFLARSSSRMQVGWGMLLLTQGTKSIAPLKCAC